MKGSERTAFERAIAFEEESIELALSSRARRGDTKAITLLLQRRQDSARHRFLLGALESQGDVAQAQIRLLQAVARGEMSAVDASHVATLVNLRGEAIKRADDERRLRQLEDRVSAETKRFQ